MTKVVVLQLKDGVKPSLSEIKKHEQKTYDGAANKDGSWKKGWNPFIQGFVRKEELGVYTIIHNLKTKNYSVSVSLIDQLGSFEIQEVGEVSFKLKIKYNNEPIDSEFRFSIFLMEQNG